MATFTTAPDYSSPVDEQPRVLNAQFGDGYSQRVGDGINIRPQVWSLTFKNRTASELSTILTFLRAQNGIASFDWTAPDGTVGKYVCKAWSYTPNNAATNTVSAKFEQVWGE